MNNENLTEFYDWQEVEGRISKPKIQLLTLEKLRLDINKMINNSEDLHMNPGIEEMGKNFDSLLNTYYDLGDL
ncbi:hypothetical protein Ana3638_11035 [Anaerocolumna sedimenticola]|uniref:Uncharacterized protein n=1 Tax=Anaerocolumna sedimenticola TaxID=2696063 RepID=A0A6P1TMW2_9FIRM|nr:hypothetical protein [Anaerocolumna sedimenticola]QHQ61241.1 hypothetical protein Ana3638_11035 [Anaerocolumna sedimenticola]